MKKSLLLLSVAALFAAPAVAFAGEVTGEWSQPLYNNDNNTMGVEDPNGPGADNVDGDLTGAGTWVENIEANEISNGIIVGYETSLEFVNGRWREVERPVYAVREEGTNKADRAKDPAVKAPEAPKAEDKKEETKPAAKDVKAAATKTAAKALPKTSAAK